LNEQYLNLAKKKVKDVRVLINAASKRATEISHGARPLIATLPTDTTSPLDIALQEIIEGKLEIKEPIMSTDVIN